MACNAKPVRPQGPLRRWIGVILVTVGMHTQPFDRLVAAADELAALVDEQVVIQCGAATYLPRFAQHVDFVPGDRMQTWLSDSRIVVSHAGAGSILDALCASKPLVLAPRLKCFDEHIDDHQLELAETLDEQERAVMLTKLSAETLAEAIVQAERLAGEEVLNETSLQSALRNWLAEQAERSPPSRWGLFRKNTGSERIL